MMLVKFSTIKFLKKVPILFRAFITLSMAVKLKSYRLKEVIKEYLKIKPRLKLKI